MGQIIYPYKKRFQGPWLIDQENLDSLDTVMKSISSLLHSSWMNQIESDVLSTNKDLNEDKLNELLKKRKLDSQEVNKPTIEFILSSKDKTLLKDESIRGLLKDNLLKNLEPLNFSVNINYGKYKENSFFLSLSNRHYGELEYDISCSDSYMSDEVQYEIDNWIEKIKPSRALEIWSNYGVYITLALTLPLIFFAIESFTTSHTTYKEFVGLQMFELSKTGINQSNRDQALELLLKINSGYRPTEFQPIEKPNDPIWIRCFVATLFIWLASIFRPKTIIGLGKMKTKLKITKTWITLVIITIPTITLVGPFWQLVLKWFY